MVSVVIYDLEIIAAVPIPSEPVVENLQYCLGWEDYPGMGISVLCAYTTADETYHIYMQDNLHEFQDLVDGCHVVAGFNNKRFDNNVCVANGIKIPDHKNYDMWVEITNTQPPNRRRGFSLDNILKANKYAGKIGHASEAPMLAQTGKWGKLINYCLDDTQKHVRVYRLILADNLLNPKNGEPILNIRKPHDIFIGEARAN
jgi:hypothetical protein